ncbi:MAG: bacteriohemerythrin [Gammaproteobacteria bacterium]|nr:bacteriohemerythrin [Gammaproteobacteria bacterium]MBU1480883.1 bacteriohemerythrin [Gammaproteobacteria bacterium]
MAKTIWTSNLNTGIEAIDKQHKMIVEYINQLDDAKSCAGNKELVAKVIKNLVNYTISHFEYEERMLEQAEYPFLKAHKNIHELFVRRVSEYQNRFKLGENITEELHDLMFNWLFGHIKHDDMDYVSSISNNYSLQEDFSEGKRGFLGRLFG